MKACRPARIAFLSLAAFLIPIDGLMASAVNVSQGACLYDLDHSADRAFEISEAQSMHIDGGGVVDAGGQHRESYRNPDQQRAIRFQARCAGALYCELQQRPLPGRHVMTKRALMRLSQASFDVKKMWSPDMNIRRLALFVFSFALLFHPHQALASTPTYDQCVYALDQTASKALNVNGAIIINAPSCGVVVDSSSSTALSFSGSGSFTAKYFDVVGGYTTSGAVSFTPTPTTKSTYQSNPLTFLVPPVSTACNYTNFSVTTGSSTLNPGTYCNGITISGATNVTFNPGTYILMGGGLNVTGASILKGTGVTFFLTQGLGYNYGPL